VGQRRRSLFHGKKYVIFGNYMVSERALVASGDTCSVL
jgi:hypothetical protein